MLGKMMREHKVNCWLVNTGWVGGAYGTGVRMSLPHTRAMGDGLFELRIKAPEGIARVFYVTQVRRRIVFLHQFVKKADKTPIRELKLARKRMKELSHV